ncbi:tyrosine-type recombinase/integrase [Vibrio sp. EA2]|uniref:tyrosine-type recombinase/integrase n=1 Tax=Vibrio sp. EA2 TaxID=3079860 RepID=UPI002949A4B1|nr:integrase arm-type DNA-binding domain-containing protein [Vibrio sp. EA2]MDV6253475.1 tyrosine-type recombinase/integrase [Vibrio sp. EA2]
MAAIFKLSDTKIKNAEPTDKEYTLSDGGNLYLRIRNNGSKNWLFIYTDSSTKKRKKIGLGSYPSLALAEVRKIAEKLREQMANNIDPKIYRDKQKLDGAIVSELTFESVAELMLERDEGKETTTRKKLLEEAQKEAEINGTDFGEEEIKRIMNKVRTSHRKRLFLKRHLYPKLGHIPLSFITTTAVIEVIKPLQAKGQLENVKRACTFVNQVMYFALNRNYIKSNCLAYIKHEFVKPKVTHMPAVPPNELAEVMATMSNHNMKLVTRCAFEMQLHTMTRAFELAAMRWCDIDFKLKLWTVPKFYTKGGREHLVPLNEYTLGLLAFMRPISGDQAHVFPSDKQNTKFPHISPYAVNSSLNLTTLKGRLVSHGFRGIASTYLNESTNFKVDAIEMCLAHLDANSTRASYNSALYLNERYEIHQYWSEYIVESTGKYYSIAGQYRTECRRSA